MRMAVVMAIASLKGSVLLLLAWAATRSLRNTSSAAARHLMWVAAIAGMLMMPLLSVVVPPMRVVPAVNVSSTVTVAPPSRSRSIAPTAPRPRSTASTIMTDAPGAEINVDWRKALPLAWAVIAALLLLRLIFNSARVAVWARRAQIVDDGDWLALVQRLSMRLGIARPVILLRSERACVPMTWGVVYPCVLLPVDADDWSDERRSIVLLHELAHVKRLDALTQLVAQLAISVFWFNPLVWLAAREMRKEREHACDDFVLQGGARASDYAHDLLQIARSLGSASAPAAAALAMARRSEFEGRLLAILDPRADRRAVSRARLAAASVGVMLLALPLAALAPAAPAARQAVIVLPATARDTVTKFVAVAQQRAHLRRKPESLPPDQATPTRPIAESPNQQTPPDRETLIAIARSAAKMTSDYEKGELLMSVAQYYMPDDELRTVYLDAVGTLTSDYERGRTLDALFAKDKALPPKAVAQVVKVASAMTSDYEKANVIMGIVLHSSQLLPETRTALISGLSSITGDYDRHRTISAIVARGEFNADDAIGMIDAAGSMTSSYEKANALIEIANKYGLNDAGVRKAYFKAADTISSATDYRRAMAGVLK